MQSQQSTNTGSKSSKTGYWIAAVTVLFAASATLTYVLIVQNKNYTEYENDTSAQITDINLQLQKSKELSQKRQDDLDQANELQQSLSSELLTVQANAEELSKQVSEAQTKITDLTILNETIEEQRKINTDSSEIQRMLLYYTFRQLHREQEKDPEYAAIDLLNYTTDRLKTLTRRKSPQAEARMRYQLARLYSTLRNYEGSQKQAELAVSSRTKVLGEDHPDTIKAIAHLAHSLHQQGNYELAADTYNQALAGARRQYGDDHFETRQILELLVTSLEGLKKFDDLVIAQKEILRIRKLKTSRREDYLHYSMLHLGKALRNAGCYEEAESTFRDLIKSCINVSGPDDKSTFEAKVCLAWTLRLQEKNDEADILHKELTSLAKFMYAINRRLADYSYGRYLCYLGNFEEAEFYLLRNYGPREQSIFTIRGVDLNPALDSLIELYEAWGKHDEAEKMRKQLVVPDLNAG